ncbi:MAG: amidohydrolase family protein [Ktedonobacterales bacterium]|nr:amidohydrolase family protein [Ktedonobacterales bacterium]
MTKTVITGAQVIDGTGRDPLAQATVVVEDGRIASVKARGAVPRGATVIDGTGMTLLPGLIDTHVHFLFDGANLVQQLMTPFSLSLYEVIPRAARTLAGGVTTVRDAGYAPAGLRDAIARGLFPGPRMQVAITILSQTGGHADNTMPCGVCLNVASPELPPRVVDGVDAMRQRVREILRAGADWIKVCATGGVLSPTDSPMASQFTEAELRAAVEEGEAHGHVEVMAHAQGTRGIKNAIRAGVRSIEHGIWLDDEAIHMMIDRDVYLVPTLVAPLQVVRRAEADPSSMPEYAVRKSRQVIADHQASFARAVAAGVKVAMGTDSGVGPHGENAEELALMVAGGMTPMEAIVATTRNAATLLKLDQDLGTIAANKIADLILVSGDPLADITVLQPHANIALVMQNGTVVKNLVSERVTA